jgi:hypothetical protein
MHVPIFHRWLTRLLERWAERGAAEMPPHDGAIHPVYRYNGRYRVTLLLFFVLLLGLCWYSWAYPEEFRGKPVWLLWFVRVALTGTVVVGIGELAQAFRWSATTTSSELVINDTLGRQQRVRWSDITDVIDDRGKRQLRVRHTAGESRISYHVHGLPQLRRLLESLASLRRGPRSKPGR